MNGIYNPIIFYPTAIVMILCAILAIKFKNIFYSLLSAIAVFFVTGIFFYILGSEYNAIVQIAIYGIAVPIILGLAIMFTNFKEKEVKEKSSNLKYVVFLIGGIYILALTYLIMISLVFNPSGFNISEEINISYQQMIGAFSQGIFVKYVFAFEIISLILTIIVAGLTLFNKKEDECKK